MHFEVVLNKHHPLARRFWFPAQDERRIGYEAASWLTDVNEVLNGMYWNGGHDGNESLKTDKVK